MSEASDIVSGVSELPLFPLAVVLFPGVPLPLHIFEPRYRQMLDDIRVGHNLFGLSYFDASTSEKEIPPVGQHWLRGEGDRHPGLAGRPFKYSDSRRDQVSH